MSDLLLQRLAQFFIENETANSFLSEDGDGGYVAAVDRMAREIERLRPPPDLVERLRRAASEQSGHEWPELAQAADEIERLRAALGAAASALEAIAEWVDSEGHHGTAQGIGYDAKKARAAGSVCEASPDD